MKIQPNQLYLISNFSNQRQVIFHQHFDFFIFTKMVNKYLSPLCDIHAYVILPNHFQLLITVNNKGTQTYQLGKVESTRITNALRLLQSNYAKYRNRKYMLSGSSFKQKPKWHLIKKLAEAHIYIEQIHHCPTSFSLANNNQDWPFSSIHDFIHTIKAHKFIHITPINIHKYNNSQKGYYTTLSAHDDEAKASGFALKV